jgi:hypothetical protein
VSPKCDRKAEIDGKGNACHAKNSLRVISGRRQPIGKAAAESMAIEALGFWAEDFSRLSRFLTLSGLGRDNLRAAAEEPAFLAAVLDHLSSDEAALLAFAVKSGHEPAAIARARELLSPPLEWP